MNLRKWLVLCVFLTGCGAAVPSAVAHSHSTPAAVRLTGVGCMTSTGTLLTAAAMPTSVVMLAEAATPKLGLLGNGDARYPTFVGRVARVFDWTNLSSTTVRNMVNQAWSQLNYSGTAPAGFLPTGGPLYSNYPTQIFRITEAVDNFGSISEAESWMSGQRSDNTPNANPATRNGVETNPQVATIGGDTFAYQITKAAGGDILTEVEIRQGDLVLGVSIDGAPQSSGLQIASSLTRSLLAKEQATCAAA